MRPQIDIEAARAAIFAEGSAGRQALAFVRPLFRFAPVALCLFLVLALDRRVRSGRIDRAQGYARIAFLLGTLALGPGLVVNVALKENSQRPRPFQTAEIVGAGAEFRPFYEFDGACARNCSFSSGESAGGFWTTAPALLAPPHLRGAAVAAALAYGGIVAAMRMGLGAHYLSDVAFSAAAILAINVAAWRLLRRARPRGEDALRAAEARP